MNFCQYVHFNGQNVVFSCEVFFYFKVLGFEMQKIDFFKKKKCFESSFYKIDI